MRSLIILIVLCFITFESNAQIDTRGRITNLTCVSVEYSPYIGNPQSKKQQEQRDIRIAELEKEGNDYGLIREAKNALKGVS